MVVVVEDVKGEEEEMEMEVVVVEDVKDPLEELEELVVLALMDQTPTVSGTDLMAAEEVEEVEVMVTEEEEVKAEEDVMEMEVGAAEVVKVPLEVLEELEVLVVWALTDQTPTVYGMDLMVVVVEDVKGEEEEMEMEGVEVEDVKDPLEELEVSVVSVESDQPALTPTVCGTDPGVATEIRVTRLEGGAENRKTIIEDQEMGKLAKLRD